MVHQRITMGVAARLGPAGWGGVGRGAVWPGAVWWGRARGPMVHQQITMEWFGEARLGVARQGSVRHGVAGQGLQWGSNIYN